MNDDLERAEARIGRVLNEKWMLEQLLGLGGMAAVYRARHRNGARAAVKILHADLSRNAEIRRRFVHEAKAANRVEHPGAVSIIDDDVVKSGEDADAAFLVMELLEGQSVSERLEAIGGRMSEAEVLAIAKQVLDVLEAAHRKGIVHRDLKPDNLFLVRDPTLDVRTGFPWTRVKVLDFGIARARDDGDAHHTKTGAMLGTPAYMSPEQALGKQDEIDGRTDLYALGATMFRLLTGRKVHESSSSNEAMVKVATQPARPLRAVVPESSASMAAIVDRALRFGRDERYPNAAAMREEVRAAIVSPLRPAAVPIEPMVAIAATLQREPPERPSRRPIALFAAVGLLLAILGLVYALWPATQDEETQEKRSAEEPEPSPKKPAFESDGKGGWKKKN